VLSETTILVNLPPGTALLVPVVVLINIGNQVRSSSTSYISYASPVLLGLYHTNCLSNIDTSSVSGCPRTGGDTLLVWGENFGNQGAVVLVGSRVCKDLFHCGSSLTATTECFSLIRSTESELQDLSSYLLHPSNGIVCTLPPGTARDVPIIFIQSGGRVANSTLQLSYVQCEPGTYQEQIGTGCLECSAGTVSQQEGQSSCTSCEPGRFSNELRGTACSNCEPGKFQPNRTSTECALCQEGSYATSGSVTCSLCLNAQEYQALPGQARCAVCPSNSIPDPTHTTCLCQVNFYAVPFGNYLLFQQLDPSNYEAYMATYELAGNVSNPSQEIGFWCVMCPQGADCTLPGRTQASVRALAGYFPGLDSNGTVFFACLNNACGENGVCADGYRGFSCTECDEDLVQDGFECKRCLEFGYTILFFVLFLLAFAAFTVYSYFEKRKGEFKTINVFFKISVSTCQLNALALSYSFDWSSQMDELLQVQGQVASLGTTYLDVQCIFPGRASLNLFYTESLIFLLFPVCIAVLTFLVKFFERLIKGSCRCAEAFTNATRSASSIIFTILFFLQPYLVERFALVFSCVRLGADSTDLFMSESLDVRCWVSRQHILYCVMFGLPYFFLYVIGIPYMFYRMLNLNIDRVHAVIDTFEKTPLASHARKENLGALPTTDLDLFRSPTISVASLLSQNSDASFIRNYGFLFFGYSKACFSWEVLVIARKAIISLLGVALSFDVRIQGMIGMLVIFAMTVAHAFNHPFVDPRLNQFELYSLSCSGFTFFFGILTLDAGDSGSKLPASSICAFLVNISYLCFVLVVVIIYGVQTKSKRADEVLNNHCISVEMSPTVDLPGLASAEKYGEEAEISPAGNTKGSEVMLTVNPSKTSPLQMDGVAV
jgi:hypothetical protein